MPPRPSADAGPSDAGIACGLATLQAASDADGDGIYWIFEANASDDIDGDGLANPDDPDSDGDGVPDSEESGQDSPCDLPIDSDADGRADFLDIDSDNDGVADGVELAAGLDRFSRDSDGDGCPDSVDHFVGGCRPNDVIFEACHDRFSPRTVSVRWSGPEPLPSVTIEFRQDERVVTPASVTTAFVVPAGAAVPGEMEFTDIQSGARLGFDVLHDTRRRRELFESYRWVALDRTSGRELADGRLLIAGQYPCFARRF